MIEIKQGKKYLITGGSGFLGIPLCIELLSRGAEVRVLARDEGKLIALKQKLPAVEIISGDVSDEFEVRQAMYGMSGVFHLAASKHVGLAEILVRENIKTNTIGSLHIFEQSLKNKIDFVICVSTDKAAQVSGVYGATKMLMERLSHQYEKINPECQYRVVRYGNVLYSTGSVLCKWKELIECDKTVIITDPTATRFFWTVDQAIQLIFDCLNDAEDSTPYCPSMKSMKMGDLLDAMIQKYSASDSCGPDIKTIGLQPGENKHERILENGPSSAETEHFTIEEIKKLI